MVEAPEEFIQEGAAKGLSEVDVEISRPMAPPPVKTKIARKIGDVFEFVVKWAPEEDLMTAI